MNIRLTVNRSDGKSVFGNEEALSFRKSGNFVAVFADVELKDGFLRADDGLICNLSDIPKGRFVCNYMISSCWSAPFFGKELSEVPKETQAFLSEDEGGYFCIIPLVGEKYRTYLVGEEKGLKSVTYSSVGFIGKCKEPLFVYGRGENAYSLLKELFAFAVNCANKKIPMREERKFPAELEYLGWCSWDALHIGVSEKGVLEKCREFNEKNVPVKWLLIDDMWADCPRLNEIPKEADFWDMVKEMHKTTIRSFTADEKRFPNGLKGCIDKIKEYGFSAAIWFPVTGYWRGFDPDGEEIGKYPYDFVAAKDSCMLVRPEKENFKNVFSRFAGYIKDCGGSFIKVDRQSCLRLYAGIKSVGECASALSSSLEEIAFGYFDGNIINCMGMSSENMLNRERSAIVRCSDDFMPDDEEWFKKHIVHCAYNTLFWGNLYYTDWDMFWTNDKQALKNVVLHALSGGPVYISDRIGDTTFDLLSRLCDKDGKLIRADGTLVPVKECLFSDAEKENVPVTLFNVKNGSVVLSAFNICADEAASADIALSQFGFKSEEIFVYDVFGKNARKYRSDGIFRIQLENSERIGLYILSEIKGGFAVIGDTEKFLCPYNAICANGESVFVKEGVCVLASEKTLRIEGAANVDKKGNLYFCETGGKAVLKAIIK